MANCKINPFAAAIHRFSLFDGLSTYSASTLAGSRTTIENAFALLSLICRYSKWQAFLSATQSEFEPIDPPISLLPSLIHTTTVSSFLSHTPLAIHPQSCDTILSIQNQSNTRFNQYVPPCFHSCLSHN